MRPAAFVESKRMVQSGWKDCVSHGWSRLKLRSADGAVPKFDSWLEIIDIE